MANMAKVLRDEITRLGRKEARSETSLLKKQSAQYRRDIAVLKRQVADLSRKVTYFQKQEKKRVSEVPAGEAPKNARFRADGLKSHRERLGISAADYARLVGCSALSIYHWESGKSKPRTEQLARLIEVRSLGVREAQQRLELLDGE